MNFLFKICNILELQLCNFCNGYCGTGPIFGIYNLKLRYIIHFQGLTMASKSFWYLFRKTVIYVSKWPSVWLKYHCDAMLHQVVFHPLHCLCCLMWWCIVKNQSRSRTSSGDDPWHELVGEHIHKGYCIHLQVRGHRVHWRETMNSIDGDAHHDACHATVLRAGFEQQFLVFWAQLLLLRLADGHPDHVVLGGLRRLQAKKLFILKPPFVNIKMIRRCHHFHSASSSSPR